jgi:hypothetical protein
LNFFFLYNVQFPAKKNEQCLIKETKYIITYCSISIYRMQLRTKHNSCKY